RAPCAGGGGGPPPGPCMRPGGGAGGSATSACTPTATRSASPVPVPMPASHPRPLRRAPGAKQRAMTMPTANGEETSMGSDPEEEGQGPTACTPGPGCSEAGEACGADEVYGLYAGGIRDGVANCAD